MFDEFFEYEAMTFALGGELACPEFGFSRQYALNSLLSIHLAGSTGLAGLVGRGVYFLVG